MRKVIAFGISGILFFCLFIIFLQSGPTKNAGEEPLVNWKANTQELIANLDRYIGQYDALLQDSIFTMEGFDSIQKNILHTVNQLNDRFPLFEEQRKSIASLNHNLMGFDASTATIEEAILVKNKIKILHDDFSHNLKGMEVDDAHRRSEAQNITLYALAGAGLLSFVMGIRIQSKSKKDII